MGSQGIEIGRGIHDIRRTCCDCGKDFGSKDYEKNIRCPACREKRNPNPSALTNRRRMVSTKCHSCGKTTQVQAYTLTRRTQAGEPIYCKQCVKLRQAAGRKAAKARERQEITVTEFMAPCRMVIVPKRAGMTSRCAPALAGRCHMVCECIDFAARNQWDGWRMAVK